MKTSSIDGTVRVKLLCHTSWRLVKWTRGPELWVSVILLPLLFSNSCAAQTASVSQQPSPSPSPQLDVNWLYGAYVPKDAPLEPLTGHQRFKLFLRQSFTTPGIYAKTAMFSVGDQIDNSPPEWGTGFDGYAKRVGSRQGQFVIQNALVAAGNAVLGYEPRYDRCRCSGVWPRTGHAVLRAFFTYDRTEKHLRPQLPLYAGAFGAGVVAGTWKPHSDLPAEGYRGAITQTIFGVAANWYGEFAPDINRILRGKKAKDKTSTLTRVD